MKRIISKETIDIDDQSSSTSSSNKSSNRNNQHDDYQHHNSLQEIRDGLAHRNINEVKSGFQHAAEDFRHDAKERVEKIGERFRVLFTFEELDPWFQSNRYVRAGYRDQMTTWQALGSLFQVHNELVNIWTHLLSAIWFGWLSYQDFQKPESKPIAIYCLFGIVMFLASTLFHLFQGLGVEASRVLAKLDYFGILVQICGSFCTAFYYSFYCQDDIRLFYQIGIVLMCVIGLYVSLSEKFSKPDYALVRVLVFALIISYAIVPLLHQVYIHGFFGYEIVNLASGFLVMVGIYLIGAIIYAFNIPERFASGHFDIVGHSHQWWHLCVTFAAYLHYSCLHEYLDYRTRYPCSDANVTTLIEAHSNATATAMIQQLSTLIANITSSSTKN